MAQAWPAGLWGQIRVLVAVSGGADSVALLYSLQRLSALQPLSGAQPGELVVAHFNHHLRGDASDRDQRFVSQLATSLGLRCEVGHAITLGEGETPDGVEAAARQARYQFLVETAERLAARYVVTAHTADDQAETILHHIVRGTGLAGLAGIPRLRLLSPAVTLFRPLLDVHRTSVTNYLEMLGQAFCEDETNRDHSLTRNRIRHELLPVLARDYSPAIVESLLRLGALAGDAQHVIETAADALLDSALVPAEPNLATLDCRILRAAERHLVRESFVALWRRMQWPRQSMGYDQWTMLAEMVGAAGSVVPAPLILPGAIRAQKTGEQLVLARS